MRNVAFAIGILTTGIAWAASPGLPAGSYTGTATWRGPGGSTGTYAVERSFSGGTMTTHFAWSEPQPREEKVTMTLALQGAEPLFDVLDESGQIVGKGYCYDGTCAYRATLGPVTLDETLRWGDGSLEVVGAKWGPGFAVAWKEVLASR
jgi:hypothetical protein